MIRQALIWSACILLMAGFTFWQLSTTRTGIDADFLSLIGQEQDTKPKEITDIDTVRTLLAENGRQAIIMLSHSDRDRLSSVAQHFADAIRAIDGTQTVTLPGHNAGRLDDLRALYGRYTSGLLSDEYRDALVNGHGDAIYQRTLRTLYSPASPFTSESLRQDPFLLMPDFLTNLAQKLGAGNDIVTVNDRIYLPIIVALEPGTHSGAAAKNWVVRTNHIIEATEKNNSGLHIAKTGQIFFAVNEAENAKKDVQTIAIIATVGIALMIGLTFFSPLPLIGAVLVVGSGLIAGAAALTLIFDTIHAIALVFGATMIGISIDYALHYLVVPANGTPTAARFEKIRTGLGFGLMTSVIGFSALALGPTNLLLQIAIYSIAGLISAYLSVKFLLPLIPQRPVRNNSPIIMVHDCLISALAVLVPCRKTRLFVAGALIIALPVSAFLIPGYDDVRALGQSNLALVSDARAISQTLGLGGKPVFVRINGQSAQERLETSEDIRKALAPLIAKGQIGGIVTLSDFVPSIARQKNDRILIRDELHQPFSVMLTDVLQTTVQIPDLNTPYLTPKQAINDLPELDRFQAGTSDIMRLRDIADMGVVGSIVDSFSKATLIEPTTIISNQFAEYRYWAYVALSIVLVIALILSVMRYGIDRGVRVFSAPAGAILIALTGGYAIGIPISFFTAMAMFLVFAIGADYVLFLSEGPTEGHLGSTRLAVFLSLISSILAFGLLATSSVPLVSDIGTVIAIGLAGAWFFAFWMTASTDQTTKTGGNK